MPTPHIPVAMLQLNCHFDGIRGTSTQKEEKFNIFKMVIFFTEILFFWENGTLEKYCVKVNRPDLT